MADLCAGPAVYRPRRARESPLHRLAETHYETFKQVYDERFASRYGAWRGVVERTLLAFPDCGIEEHGFARVRCGACRREFRVSLSCKRRGFCPLGLGRSTGASSRSSQRPPAAVLLRPAGALATRSARFCGPSG
jgi:hypothetical protein